MYDRVRAKRQQYDENSRANRNAGKQIVLGARRNGGSCLINCRSIRENGSHFDSVDDVEFWKQSGRRIEKDSFRVRSGQDQISSLAIVSSLTRFQPFESFFFRYLKKCRIWKIVFAQFDVSYKRR